MHKPVDATLLRSVGMTGLAESLYKINGTVYIYVMLTYKSTHTHIENMLDLHLLNFHLQFPISPCLLLSSALISSFQCPGLALSVN